MNFHRTAALLVALLTITDTVFANPPNVLVSIKPVHSLIAGVMKGVSEPGLLLAGAASPHTYAMRPSDGRKLHEADIVFWIGPSLESFLVKPLSTLDSRTRIVTLIKQKDIHLLRMRSPHRHTHNNESTYFDDLELDPHIWLDLDNAQQIVRIAAAILSDIDPARQQTYYNNGNKIVAHLNTLDDEIRERLHSVVEIPYVVFHDAYQHFENRYGLNSLAAITVNAGQTPGAKSAVAIKNLIAEENVKCVFAEPQFEPKILKTITEDVNIETGTLDSLGAIIEPGVSAYEEIMMGIADSLVSCLRRT